MRLMQYNGLEEMVVEGFDSPLLNKDKRGSLTRVYAPWLQKGVMILYPVSIIKYYIMDYIIIITMTIVGFIIVGILGN